MRAGTRTRASTHGTGTAGRRDGGTADGGR